ncbi:hypothetical protein, partial [Xanthomonas campestris]
ALSVTERQLHGSLLNMRRVVSRICGALFRVSLGRVASTAGRIQVHACAPLVDLATANHVRRIAAAA